MLQLNSNRVLRHIKIMIVITLIVIGLGLFFLLVYKRYFLKTERNAVYYVGNVICLCLGLGLHEWGHISASIVSHAKVGKIKIVKGILPKITVAINTPAGFTIINRVFVLIGGIFFPVYICYIVTIFSPNMIMYMDLFLLITAINIIPISDTDGNRIKKIYADVTKGATLLCNK